MNLAQGISVVIVTFNGRKRILPTLDHLAKQVGVYFPLEVLVIDNNSTDGTAEVAVKVWKDLKSPFFFRVVQEKLPGTMNARARGIREASNRYILFCDDDNWLSSDYILKGFEIIRRNSQIAALGGKGIMMFEENFSPPEWIEPYKRNYATGPQGKLDGDTTFDKGCLYSAGSLFDKLWIEKLDKYGFTSSLKGRDGKKLIAGEDTELTYALKIIGGRLYYSSELTFRHFMPKERINWEYLKKLWRSFGYSDFIISPYYNSSARGDFFSLVRLIRNNLKVVIKLILSKRKKEGDLKELRLQRKVGELKAMLFSNSVYKSNIKMRNTLLKMKAN